ncbi:50S ribosomal protein L3 N(5)-glutamine methyltransferase [Neptunomonas sp. XY-337]|uniref:50S ribosomal protein L3 N(5)-glutamine methyltransferase n=1 Tax=Neptunomonas sp. XY-337 TaxID=2561897 RepID=UPI0010A9C896|nr:50S ribosomal protein L3 N(5)-glutamine methyltransferase [Neptunomonas sp. XY-337]
MFDQALLKNELCTIRDFIRWTCTQMNQHGVYFGHGHVNAWDEASQLVLAAVKLPWDSSETVLDARLLSSEKETVISYVEKRVLQRMPLPYITQEAWFLGLPFYVDERVLIPRSPIAQLLETECSPFLRPGPVERVLDLCTGSGCIGIGAAYIFEEATVDLVDISDDALAVARKNIRAHGMEERIEALQSDLFAGLQGRRYDLILSNPPYVDQADFASMPDEYQHEPELALTSGDDGLDITKRILREANEYLTEDGLLIVEVGNSEVHLMEQYPQVPLTWVELPQGGNGVFAITAQDLRQYRDEI